MKKLLVLFLFCTWNVFSQKVTGYGYNNQKSKIEEVFIDETLKGIWTLNLSILEKGLNLNGYLKITVYKNWISTNKTLSKSKVFLLKI